LKTPRDVSGRELAALLTKFGYEKTRQTGSHMRLVNDRSGNQHRITIPDHDSLRTGTLNSILGDVAQHLKISKEELVNLLFGN
jgi:predicted RNA binding protein YcfA (HicA-like mRNA interferase family)